MHDAGQGPDDRSGGLTPGEREELERFVSGYRSGGDAARLREAVFTALERTALDFETVISRARWLVDDSGRTSIALLSRHPAMTAKQLADRIGSPREAVFDFITAQSDIDRDTVERIYAAARRITRDPFGLRDLSEERILQEMKWWILELGFPGYYFETTPPEEIAHQITVNRFYEIQGLDSQSYRSLRISYRSADGTGIHWVHREKKYLEVEHEIESAYRWGKTVLDIAVYTHADLYLYIVRSSQAPEGAGDFSSSAPPSFTGETDEERFSRYRELYARVRADRSLHVEHSVKDGTGEHRLMIGFPAGMIGHFLADPSRVIARYGIRLRRKYAVAFTGDVPIIVSSFYSDAPFPRDILSRLVETSLYPESRFSRLVEAGLLTTAEAGFAHALVAYVHAFISRRDPNLEHLERRFAHDPAFREASVALGRRLSKEAYPPSKIEGLLSSRRDVVKKLFSVFSLKFDPASPADGETVGRALEALSSELGTPPVDREEQELFACALTLITRTVRTNFFLPRKTALAFRLSPDAASGPGFPVAPYGVFFIRGRNFTAFHVRFSEIARGGIRIVRSGAPDEYRRNADSLLEECYNLALTQNRKNKDIPEGGAKGVILPGIDSNDPDSRRDAFMKYVDALLDMILPGGRAHIARFEEEILFLGPDEGTAELMDAASIRSRERGYAYWKAFTTGKSPHLGGVSHIYYGMTTAGIRRYVLGILGRLRQREETVTKIQTGGPDGDLGGNEILTSRDRTIGIIDGGGVLYDPEGLDRTELGRLVRERSDVSRFDTAKLSPKGFLVKVTDRDAILPDGTPVASGLAFRNGFHTGQYMKADLFLPCGGRPASINGTNWSSLLDANGKAAFRWVVEGANLFVTQEARRELEKRGVVLFKDSSTNKGGVTSSSLEVLSGLGLGDDEFNALMCAPSENEGTEFRKKYVEEILGIIAKNADDEFAVLWKTRETSGLPISDISDSLSDGILETTRAVAASRLYEDASLRKNVLLLHFPRILTETVGYETLVSRIPGSYLRAIFARTIARKFAYAYGLSPGYEEYRTFIEDLRKG